MWDMKFVDRIDEAARLKDALAREKSSLVVMFGRRRLGKSTLIKRVFLEGAAYDVLKGMHRENVIYAEIRFAPLLSENESMSCERVIEATIKGLERGKKNFGIEYGLIVCAMRHHSEEQNRRMLHTAREFLGEIGRASCRERV